MALPPGPYDDGLDRPDVGEDTEVDEHGNPICPGCDAVWPDPCQCRAIADAEYERDFGVPDRRYP